MTIEQKKNIIKRLVETHQALEKTIEGLNLELVIHADTGWMIRDILGHVATWDRVLIHTIQTFLEGSEYIIPGMAGDETDYNQEKFLEQRKLPTSQILQEWNQARKDFIEAVQQIPTDKFNDELAYPWGDERGSLAVMIEYMVDHDGEHQEEILAAI
ncbi:MAG TPA: DinB family protein [Chloroflexi bacterium]|nr:DinB family protein [Chloroflexota bacterium]